MSVCAAPTCSHQSFDGSSYYVDVDVDHDASTPHPIIMLMTKEYRMFYNAANI